jgi:hypothetical protein
MKKEPPLTNQSITSVCNHHHTRNTYTAITPVKCPPSTSSSSSSHSSSSALLCTVHITSYCMYRLVKYGDTRVRRWSMECTRRQITRTVASTYVLHPHELLIRYFGGLEYKSGVKGGELWVVCLTFKWTRSSVNLGRE